MGGNIRQGALFLASESARRRELLARLGLEFVVSVSGVDEDLIEGASAARTAEMRARAKAWAVASTVKSGLVLAADTVIELCDADLGKTDSAEVARRILTLISGKHCSAVTALTLLEVRSSGVASERSSTVRSEIWMKPYGSDRIDEYVRTGEFQGRAGAFAIQGLGGDLVESWHGCFYNIVGLPLCEVARLVGESQDEPIPADCRHG